MVTRLIEIFALRVKDILEGRIEPPVEPGNPSSSYPWGKVEVSWPKAVPQGALGPDGPSSARPSEGAEAANPHGSGADPSPKKKAKQKTTGR